MRSEASPRRTVSFISLSKGTEGVDVSSRVKLYHEGIEEEASILLPMRPTSDEVLSPTNKRNLVCSQPRRTVVKAPGGRMPGNGRYGVMSLISCTVLALESKTMMRCVCSTSGADESGGP